MIDPKNNNRGTNAKKSITKIQSKRKETNAIER